MSWADAAPQLRVRANADQPDQADGLGRLRRPGHRPVPHRAHVLRRGEDRPDARDDRRRERGRAAQGAGEAPAGPARGLPRHLQGDGGRPVTIRTLDPPLHEFLPHDEAGVRELAQRDRQDAWSRSARASRSSTSRTRCSATAAAASGSRTRRSPRCRPAPCSRRRCDVAPRGQKVEPEVMIPLVGTKKELDHQATMVRATAEEVFAERGRKVELHGRHDDRGAARRADRGRDREDRRVLLVRHERPHADDLRPLARRRPRSSRPTARRTSARSIRSSASTARASARSCRSAVEQGRATKPNLKLGICGEHGGDPSSVEFCHELGLDYVSCSPYRLPIARLAAAQAALKTT